jgi:hypothetical protein
MANKFFDRNKKKSLLGLLLLWIKENRTLSALLLVVALSSFLFIAPSAMVLNLPGGTRVVAGIAWLASRMGVDTSKWGFFARGGAHSYDDFIAALRQAKENGSRPAGWGAFFGKNPAAARVGAGRSSLDMVQGRRSDLEGGGYPKGKLPEGKDVAGIMNPEDMKESEEGVTVDDELLAQQRGALVRDANAGGFAPGARDLLGFAGGAGGLGGGSAGAGAYVGKGTFGGNGTGAGTRPGDNIRGALATTDPGTAPRPRIQGATQGRLSKARAASISARVQRGIQSQSVNSHRAFAQLADGRGRAAIATTPNCVPPGCPGEFATTNTGAIYDGNAVTGSGTDILNAPEVDGSTPQIPDTSVADGYMRDASQLEADAKKCRELDEQYRDSENAAMAQMQAESDKFESMNCGSGGCSKSKAKRCEAQGNRIKQACREYARIRNEHTNACPLTRGKGQEMNCDSRGGPNDRARQSGSQDLDNDGQSDRIEAQ